MEYTSFGQTGARVSRLGFGGAPAGLTNYLGAYSPADPIQRKQVIEAIERARSLGITYFDTAQGYGNGQSEEIFGEGLQGAGPDIFVATKTGHWETEARRVIEGSLNRLRRERLDLIQIHGDSYTVQKADEILSKGGLLEQLLKLKKKGWFAL